MVSRHALSATPVFGPLALPLILDKLQASTKSAKSQSLLVITEAFPVYGQAAVQEYDKVFWEALCVEVRFVFPFYCYHVVRAKRKTEQVFHATDKEMEALSLRALKDFLATLYPDEDKTPIKGVATKLCQHCLGELKEADKSQAAVAVKILGVALSSSGMLSALITLSLDNQLNSELTVRLASFTLEKTLPTFMNTLRNPEEASQRPAAIGHLASLLGDLRILSKPDLSAFEEDKDELVSLLSSFARLEPSRAASLQCLVHFAHLPDFLLDVERAFIVATFNDLLKSPEIAQDPTETHVVLSGLVQLIDLIPREIERSTLPILFTQLPQEAQNEDYKLALNSLARLCINPHLTETFILRLMSRIENLCQEVTSTKQLLYTHHLLFALLATLKAKVGAGHTDLPKYSDAVIGRLFAMFIGLKDQQGKIGGDARIADEAGQIVAVLCRSLDER
jgi:DNA repair/transcription protein MET18/MMS19